MYLMNRHLCILRKMNVSMLTFSVDICNLEGVYLVNLQIK